MPPAPRTGSRPCTPLTILIMPPLPPRGSVRASTAQAANARIRALYIQAADEVRDLTPAERREYERLRGVYLRAVLAA